MVEIEIRGKLTKEQFEKLKSFLEDKAKLLDNYKRLSIDLSPGFDSKTKSWKDSKFDLRLKKSGVSEKISLKIGEFHLKERKEIDVKLKEGEFLNSLKLFQMLGFDKGMLYFWESWEYEYQDFEIKVSKYTDSYFTWEIEAKEKNLNPNTLAKELNLIPYSETDYKKAIDWENKNIHKLYDYKLAKELSKKI